MPHITGLLGTFTSFQARRLLCEPHTLRLETLGIHEAEFVERSTVTSVTAMLVSIPTLKHLHVSGAKDFQFIRLLPNLQTLRLSSFATQLISSAAELCVGVGVGVGVCTQLTALTIECEPHLSSWLDTKHLCTLLAGLPNIATLSIANLDQLRSIRFLASKPLRHTLTAFSLAGCHFVSSDSMRHVFALQNQLVSLVIRDCFGNRQGSFDEFRAFDLPSERMPTLISSSII